MAPDSYWGNLDWLTYLYGESPMAEHVITCNSMGIGCCHKTAAEGANCWEYGDAPSGGKVRTGGPDDHDVPARGWVPGVGTGAHDALLHIARGKQQAIAQPPAGSLATFTPTR